MHDIRGGRGVATDRFNRLGFERVTTDRRNLEIVGDGKKSVGILQWKVWSAGAVPAFAPVVAAGVDRAMVVGVQAYLAGKADWLQRRAGDGLRWTKVSGPGEVIFADAAASTTRATASKPGEYVLRLSANAGSQDAVSTVGLRVVAPPPAPEAATLPLLPTGSVSLHLRPAMTAEVTNQQSNRVTHWGTLTGASV